MTAPDTSQSRILVVGDVMLDRYWHGNVDRISPEAPVPVVHVTREEDRLGGCGNVAFNLVSLGAQASLLSVVCGIRHSIDTWLPVGDALKNRGASIAA